MITQETKKELGYLWNIAKDTFKFNEEFVEVVNPDLNAPRNARTRAIIEHYGWDKGAGIMKPLPLYSDDGINRSSYASALDHGLYTPEEILTARITFNASRAAGRYFHALARQDKFSESSIYDFFALEDIGLPKSTFDATGSVHPVHTPGLIFHNSEAAGWDGVQDALRTADEVASNRYESLLLTKTDIQDKPLSTGPLRSASIVQAVSNRKYPYKSPDGIPAPENQRNHDIEEHLLAENQWYARRGKETDPSRMEFIYNNASRKVLEYGETDRTEHTFYSFANGCAVSTDEAWSPRATLLVVETEFWYDGGWITRYYPIALTDSSADPGIKANTKYLVNLTIHRPGADNPETPVAIIDCTADVSIVPWTTGEPYNPVF